MPSPPRSPAATGLSRQALDAQVRAALGAGERQRAYELLLRGFGGEIYGFLFGVLRDRDIADDLYQDLALVTWRQLEGFEGRSSLRTWLYGIAHNLLRQRRKRYSQQHVARLNTSSAERICSPSNESPTRRVLSQELGRLLEMLHPAERELLIMRSERGLSFQEIGEVLGISEESAKKRFQRSRDRLRQLVLPEDEA